MEIIKWQGIIFYKRTSIDKDDTLPQDKLDANNPNLFYTFEKKFSQENRYDNFAIQIGNQPSREYYNVTVPDYVTVSYDFVVWTTYIEQMNHFNNLNSNESGEAFIPYAAVS